MQLKPHQIEGVAFLHRNQGRALLTDDPGLGKTCQAATYIKESGNTPALIVCPASVKGSWKRELQMWAGLDARIVEGRNAAVPEGYPAYVVNYDILADALKEFVKIPFKCVVFDESHYLSDRGAKRTRAAIALSRRTTHVICMSGTPISNRPADFWTTLHIIRPKQFPAFTHFAGKYCDPRRRPWGWEYKGASNLDQLHQEIKEFTLGRKQEILGLPERHIHIIPLAIDAETMAQFRKEEDEYAAWLQRQTGKKKGAEALQKTTNMLMGTSKLKAKATCMWIRDYMQQHPEKKVIVFCTHTGMLEVLYRRIAPGKALFIDGSVPSNKRTAIVQQFQTDPEIRVIVCNIKAAGAGITLTAATTTVFAELPWTPAAVDQARNRNYRIGQEKEVDLYFPVVPGSIEEKLAKVIQHKQSISDEILEGRKTDNLSLHDLLMETYKGQSK